MEVNDEYEWMEEASYKPVDGPLPVSKRQQRKGLDPQSTYRPSIVLKPREKLLSTIAKSFIDRPCPSSREGGGTK